MPTTADDPMVFKRFFTVWEFRSVCGRYVSRVVRVAEPNDTYVQHEYQRVIGQAFAFTPGEALALVNSGASSDESA